MSGDMRGTVVVFSIPFTRAGLVLASVIFVSALYLLNCLVYIFDFDS
jgi:hypothetical protein